MRQRAGEGVSAGLEGVAGCGTPELLRVKMSRAKNNVMIVDETCDGCEAVGFHL